MSEQFIPQLEKSLARRAAWEAASAEVERLRGELAAIEGTDADPRLWRVSHAGNLYRWTWPGGKAWGATTVLLRPPGATRGARRAEARRLRRIALATHARRLEGLQHLLARAEEAEREAWANYLPYKPASPGVIGTINGRPIEVPDVDAATAAGLARALVTSETDYGCEVSVCGNEITLTFDAARSAGCIQVCDG